MTPKKREQQCSRNIWICTKRKLFLYLGRYSFVWWKFKLFFKKQGDFFCLGHPITFRNKEGGATRNKKASIYPFIHPSLHYSEHHCTLTWKGNRIQLKVWDVCRLWCFTDLGIHYTFPLTGGSVDKFPKVNLCFLDIEKRTNLSAGWLELVMISLK